jgi:peptide/nickel transport system substrate-binding protein
MHGKRCLLCLVIPVLFIVLLVPCVFAGGAKEEKKAVEVTAPAELAEEAFWVQYPTVTAYKAATGKSIGKYSEAPELAALVKQGKLPPVKERLPDDPVVVKPVDNIGKYGGIWRRTWKGPADKWGISKPLGERFLWWSHDSQVMPNVAESWEVVDGGKAVIFNLRKGLKWSDGHPLTTDDVAFYINDIKFYDELDAVEPQEWDRMLHGGEPLRLEVIDKYTFKISFVVEAAEVFVQERANWGPSTMLAPAHYLRQYHSKYTSKDKLNAMAKEAGFQDWTQLFEEKNDYLRNNERPVIFAWRPVNTQSATEFIFERNPYFWKVDTAGNQLPYVDGVKVMLIEDREVILMKAVSGEIDFQARHLTIGDFPVLKEKAEQGGYNVYRYTTDMAANPSFRLNHTTENMVLRELFADVRFKQALSLGLNRQELNELLYLGLGEPRQNSYVTGSPFFSESWEKAYAEYDPARSKKLLDEIGLKMGPDGFRRDKTGKVLQITLTYTLDEHDKAMELTKSWWEDIGIKVNIQKVERSLFEERFQNNDNEINVWYNHKYLRPDFEPFYLVPSAASHAFYGPLWARWYLTGGKEGLEPPKDVKRLLELKEKLDSAMPFDELKAVMKEIGEIHERNLFYIGTVGEIPQPAVVNKKLKNVPRRVVWTGLYRNGGRILPQQMYYEE